MAKTTVSAATVPIGYRIGGLIVLVLSVSLFVIAWQAHGADWYMRLVVSLVGFMFLFPSLGMLFAENRKEAKSAALCLFPDTSSWPS